MKFDNKHVWVFILAGQSNMAGRAFIEPQDTVPSDRVFAIDQNGKIIQAKEPIHFYEPEKTGLDCGLSFGKALVENLPDSIVVLLIPTAIGGSSIEQWLNDEMLGNIKLLSNFKDKVAIGRKWGQIKGILWHQGESDANEYDISRYEENLAKLFEKFREIVENRALPILIGELGSFSKNNKNWQSINSIIRAYSRKDTNTVVISTSDLTDKGDKLHFNSESQRTMGKRFADEYVKNFISSTCKNY